MIIDLMCLMLNDYERRAEQMPDYRSPVDENDYPDAASNQFMLTKRSPCYLRKTRLSAEYILKPKN
jgi:hypothetical protein